MASEQDSKRFSFRVVVHEFRKAQLYVCLPDTTYVIFEPDDSISGKHEDLKNETGSFIFHTSNGNVSIDWDRERVYLNLGGCEFGNMNISCSNDPSFQEAMNDWLEFEKDEREYCARTKELRKRQNNPPKKRCVCNDGAQDINIQKELDKLEAERNEECRKKQKCV